MKKVFLVLMVCLFASFIYGQTKTEVKVADLKKEITDNVAKDYAGYKIDQAFKVDKSGAIVYHVIVSKDKSKMTLVYDKDGKFVNKIEPVKKSEVKISELKKEITDNIAKDYPGFNITKAIKVDDNGVITYHIYTAKENEKINLLYDKDGKFLKKNQQGKGPGVKKENTKKEEVKK